METEERNTVVKFFEGKSVLITGASGLIGKVLIWKLLHSCPNIDTIYILIRPKHGKNIQTRVEELLQVPIFNNIRDENPKLLQKVKAINGDIAVNHLGISENDEEKLTNGVNIVFHIAAILKLDADLKDAVNMNTEGTLRILKLCTKMKNLMAFIHTSTAYCHCETPVIDEKIYPLEVNPHDVINLTHWMKPEILNMITDKLIQSHPNTYTYSKRLAENIVADFYPKLPVAIARPSIVIPALEEPFPGWVDNVNGPVGLMIGAGKGVIRTMLCNSEYQADLNPVDVVVNGLIVIAWKIATDTNKMAEIPVFNLSQTEVEPITWGEVVDLGKSVVADYPFETVLWYPGGGVHSNEIVHTVLAILFHWIPAYFIDFIMLLLGQKRFMVRVQQKIYHGQKVLKYFTTRNWVFINNNILNLRDSLSSSERNIFKLTAKGLDRRPYFVNATLVTRHYILKEDPNSIPKCRVRMKMLYVLDRAVSLMFYLFLTWMLLKLFDLSFAVTDNKKPVHI